MAVRPLRLADTASKAGYDEMDPITQWFLGGSGTSGAEATGINDDDRYGLDLQNGGAGGLSLRATSGNNAHQVKIDNTSATITGGLTVTGGAMTVASLVVLGTLQVVSGAAIGGNLGVTGAAVFSTGVSVGGALSVTGSATFSTGVTMLSTLSVTGGAVFGSSLVVTGPASFITSVTVTGVLSTESITNLGNGTGDTVNMAGSATVAVNLTVLDSVNISNDLTVTSNTLLRGTCDVLSDVTIGGTALISGQLTVSDTAVITERLTLGGSLGTASTAILLTNNAVIDFDYGSSSGFTASGGATFQGSIRAKYEGAEVRIPFDFV